MQGVGVAGRCGDGGVAGEGGGEGMWLDWCQANYHCLDDDIHAMKLSTVEGGIVSSDRASGHQK